MPPLHFLGIVHGSVLLVCLLGCSSATSSSSGGGAASQGGASGAIGGQGGQNFARGGVAAGSIVPTAGGVIGGSASASGGMSSAIGGASGGTSNGKGGNAADFGGSSGHGATGGTNSLGGSAGGTSSVCITKRGFASGLEISSAAADIQALAAPAAGVSWYYGWAKSPSSQMGTSFSNAGVEFVPMIWGAAELDDANLASKVYVGTKTKYLLGFNEPNFTSQANLTPQQAATAWPKVEAIAKQLGLELVAPAVNFCGGGCNVTDPFQWLDQFLTACADCQIDYVAFHSYACDANWFINSYMKPAVQKYYTNGKPPRKIWVTEFACADSPPTGGWSVIQIDGYMRTVLSYLENEPGIFRYAWFGGNTGRTNDTYVTANNNLLGTAGQLTTLGTTYTSQVEAVSCP